MRIYSPMHPRDRAFNGVNFARKDRMFLSGRGSFAGTSPVRATFPSSRYPSSTSFVPSYNPLNLLALILPACFSTVLPAYPSENFLRTILPFFLPSSSLSLAVDHATFDSHSITMLYSLQRYVRSRHFSKQFSFLMSLPTWIITSAVKKALSSFFPAWVLFYSLTLQACRIKGE